MQKYSEQIVFSQLSENDLLNIKNSSFTKLFEVSQLSIEYLLYIQECLVTMSKTTEYNYNQISRKRSESKDLLREQQRRIIELKQKLNYRSKTMHKHCSNKLCYRCEICKNKLYSTENELKLHYQRRHQNINENVRTVNHEMIQNKVKTALNEEMGKIHELLNKLDDKIKIMAKPIETDPRTSTLGLQIKDLENKLKMLEEDKPMMEYKNKTFKENTNNLSIQERNKKISDLEKDNEEGSLDFSIESPTKEILKEAIVEEVILI